MAVINALLAYTPAEVPVELAVFAVVKAALAYVAALLAVYDGVFACRKAAFACVKAVHPRLKLFITGTNALQFWPLIRPVN